MRQLVKTAGLTLMAGKGGLCGCVFDRKRSSWKYQIEK